jgi:hypothetical protein
MKLRLDKHSLRLRVKKSDLQLLREQNSVSEIIPFPGGAFEYRLETCESLNEITAKISERSIAVTVPATIATSWMDNDEVGIYHTLAIGTESFLDIIIEKDFPCKGRRGG